MSIATAVRTLREYVSTQLPLEPYMHGSFRSVDPMLSGTTRFGKKIGTNEVILLEDTDMVLASNAATGSATVQTVAKINDVITGSIFKLPDTSLIRLYNPQQHVSNTDTYWSWTVDSETPLLTTYTAGSSLSIYGHPVTVLPGLTNEIQVRSTVPVMPGDRLIPIASTPIGLVEGQTVEILSIDTHTIIPGDIPVNSYKCTVSAQLKHLIVNTASSIYLRADTGYVSNLIPATDINGVFLLDCVSGITLGDNSEDVTITLNTHQADYTISTSYQDVQKNTPVILGVVSAADFVTGAVDRGRLVPNIDKSLYSVNDAYGLCGFGYDFCKTLNPGIKLKVSGQEGTEIRVTVATGTTLYTIGTTDTTIDLSTNQTNYVLFRITGSTNGTLLWTSLPLTEDNSFISYSIVARTNQQEEWSGSGLILKPVITSVEDSYAFSDGENFVIGGGTFL